MRYFSCAKCGHFVCECNKIKLEPILYKPVKPINPTLKFNELILPKIYTTPKILIKIDLKPTLNILKETPIKPIYPEKPKITIKKEKFLYDPLVNRPDVFKLRPIFKPLMMPKAQWLLNPAPPGFIKFP